MEYPFKPKLPVSHGEPDSCSVVRDLLVWDPEAEETLEAAGWDGTRAGLVRALECLTTPLFRSIAQECEFIGHVLRAGLAYPSGSLRARRTMPAVPRLIGREEELAATMDRLGRNPGGVSALCVRGDAGAGKTIFARTVAGMLSQRDNRPVLEVSLRPAQTADDALVRLLSALDVPATEIPADAIERRNLYHQKLQEEDPILLLEDAADASRMRPLLPPRAGSVIVTGPCAGLTDDEAFVLPLNPVEPSRLVRAWLGDQSTPQHVVEAVRTLCQGVPAIMRIVCGLLAGRPDREDRLAYLLSRPAVPSPAAVFAKEPPPWSAALKLLHEQDTRLLQAVHLLGAAGMDLEAVCVSADVGRDAALSALDRLTDHGLLTRMGDRWRENELVADFIPAPSSAQQSQMAGLLNVLQLTRLRALDDLLTLSSSITAAAPVHSWALRTSAEETAVAHAVQSLPADVEQVRGKTAPDATTDSPDILRLPDAVLSPEATAELSTRLGSLRLGSQQSEPVESGPVVEPTAARPPDGLTQIDDAIATSRGSHRGPQDPMRFALRSRCHG
ncbi:hypothetical protein [Nonomuraea monospora]